MRKTNLEILIVDDNRPMLRLLEVLLQKDYDIYPFLNVRDALHWMKTNEPDLIISDIGMPYISGIEFVWHLKTSSYYNHIPVLIISGKPKEEIYSQIQPIHIEAVIDKPFNPTELKNIITNLLMKNRGKQTPIY